MSEGKWTIPDEDVTAILQRLDHLEATKERLRAENERLRKCVVDEWDGVAADKILADVEQLRATNAELLAALEHIVQHQSAIAGPLAEFSGVVNISTLR